MGTDDVRSQGSDTCANISELISLYLDGLLSTEEIEIVEKHLAACPDCMKEKNELLEIMQLLNGVEEAAVPDEFSLRLRSALKKETARSSVIRWKALSAVAAAIFITVISYNIIADTLLFPSNNAEESAMMAKDSEAVAEADMESQSVQSFTAAPPADGAAGSASEQMRMADTTDYYQMISEKLAGYEYYIISDMPEEGEIRLMITKDSKGVAIDREFIVQYANGSLSSEDNWLGIDFE